LRDDEGKPLRGIVRRKSRIGEGGGPIKYGASGEGHGETAHETLDEAKTAAVASLVEPL
jgi:hypothetical protein